MRIREHRLYYIWVAMNQRCYNPRCKDYRWYGAKGITVCERWQAGPRWERSRFWNFVEDMYSTYFEEASIDRKDPSGHYCKDNCRWLPHNLNAIAGGASRAIRKKPSI